MTSEVPELPGLADLSLLGRGGLADVYLARQQHLERWVAAKVFRVTLADEQAAERFRAECSAIGRLDQYPHVLTVYDAGVLADGRPYLISERCDGSLHDLVGMRGPLPVDRVAALGSTIGRALRFAHSAGVLHGDVTPQNLLLRTSGAPVLADFGLAVLRDHAPTAAGFTLLHAAPEALRPGVVIDERADVYGLGSTLYTVLTGAAPFPPLPGEGDATYRARRLTEPVPRPDGVTDQLAGLLTAMLAAEPAHRPSTDEVITALETAPARGARSGRTGRTLIATRPEWDIAAEDPDDGPFAALAVTPGVWAAGRSDARATGGVDARVAGNGSDGSPAAEPGAAGSGRAGRRRPGLRRRDVPAPRPWDTRAGRRDRPQPSSPAVSVPAASEPAVSEPAAPEQGAPEQAPSEQAAPEPAASGQALASPPRPRPSEPIPAPAGDRPDPEPRTGQWPDRDVADAPAEAVAGPAMSSLPRRPVAAGTWSAASTRSDDAARATWAGRTAGAAALAGPASAPAPPRPADPRTAGSRPDADPSGRPAASRVTPTAATPVRPAVARPPAPPPEIAEPPAVPTVAGHPSDPQPDVVQPGPAAITPGPAVQPDTGDTAARAVAGDDVAPHAPAGPVRTPRAPTVGLTLGDDPVPGLDAAVAPVRIPGRRPRRRRQRRALLAAGGATAVLVAGTGATAAWRMVDDAGPDADASHPSATPAGTRPTVAPTRTPGDLPPASVLPGSTLAGVLPGPDRPVATPPTRTADPPPPERSATRRPAPRSAEATTGGRDRPDARTGTRAPRTTAARPPSDGPRTGGPASRDGRDTGRDR